MTLDRAPKAASAFEAYHQQLLVGIDALKSNLPGVKDADVEVLVSKLGGPDKVKALTNAMPDQPSIAELIAALGGAEALGDFTSQALGGNVGALAKLADKGCKRDAGALAKIATTFSGAPETLGNMLSEGGLGSHPEALAQVFADGCDGDADKLLKFCQTFDSESKRESLRGALDEGGLGQAPAAFGSLAKENDGKLLLDLAQKADKPALSDLLLKGGMGGEPPNHPDTLKSVLVDALGGDATRLKDLHDAFPHVGDNMSEMQTFFRAMNGKSQTGDAMAGERMDTLMKAFKDRDSALTPEQMIQKLYDPYFVQVTKSASDARGLDEAGGGTIARANKVITDRADPPKGRIAAAIIDTLPDGAAADLLSMLTTDPKAQQQLQDARDRILLSEAEDAALRKDTDDHAPDTALSEATGAAISLVNKLRSALDSKLDGGSVKEVEALTRAAEDCVTAARSEPGGVLRTEALEAAKTAMATARKALERQAATKIAGLAGSEGQQSALAAAGSMARRIENDASGSEAEKAAMNVAAKSAGQALEAKALANQVVDADAMASGVTDACAKRLGKEPDSAEVTAELARLKKQAEDAEKLAVGLTAALKSAPQPIDPTLLARAGEAAQGAVSAGLETADKVAMQAAIAAGKALADAVSKCAAGMAASAEISFAFASDKAKTAVLALSDMDAMQAALKRDIANATGPTVALKAELEGLQKAAVETSKSALAAAELDRIEKTDKDELDAAALAGAMRQAAIEGVDLDAAKGTANDLAKAKAQAAKDAADALDGLSAPVADGLIRAATKAAQEAADAALGATDKTQRDAAVSQGLRAAAAASKALGDNAKHKMAARTLANKADADASTNASRGPADIFATNFAAGRAGLKAAVNTAMNDIGEAAASQLSELAAGDGAVQDARAEAAKAAAAADRPGASELKKLLPTKADSDAQAALAALAAASAAGAVHGLVDVAPPDWPPVLVDPPPPPHYVQATKPVAPTEAELQNATILCEAAITACTKWVASATQYRDAANAILKRAKSTPEPVRSATEKSDFTKIESLADDAAGAPKQLVDAKNALAGMNAISGELEEKAQHLMFAMQIARIKFDPPGDAFDAAHTSKDASDTALENAAGYAGMIATRAFKTVGLPGGMQETFGPCSRDSLMAIGANMAKKALPGDFVDPSEPPPPPPPARIAVSNNADITGHADCKLDIKHMCERHCRSHFTFSPGELKAEEDILACAMLKGRISGLNKDAGTNGAAADLFSSDENKVKKIGSGKTTTLWPEGVTPDDIAAAATLALVKLKALNTGTDPFAKFVYDTDAKHQLSEIVSGIKVGSHTLDVALGVSAANDAGPVRVVMFYPIGQESLTVADCHKLKAALGI